MRFLRLDAGFIQLVSDVWKRTVRELFARVDDEFRADCSDHLNLTLEEMEEGLRSGRLSIVDAVVVPVSCSSPEEAAAARAGRCADMKLWLVDLATGPDETAVLRYNAETGDMEPLGPEYCGAKFVDE